MRKSPPKKTVITGRQKSGMPEASGGCAVVVFAPGLGALVLLGYGLVVIIQRTVA